MHSSVVHVGIYSFSKKKKTRSCSDSLKTTLRISVAQDILSLAFLPLLLYKKWKTAQGISTKNFQSTSQSQKLNKVDSAKFRIQVPDEQKKVLIQKWTCGKKHKNCGKTSVWNQLFESQLISDVSGLSQLANGSSMLALLRLWVAMPGTRFGVHIFQLKFSIVGGYS